MTSILKNIVPKIILNIYRKYKNWKKEKKRLKPYKGNKVKCPICNSKFSHFGAFGVVPRKNARCHKCGSLERHRLLWLYINNKFNFLSEKNYKFKLLHFAPEEMLYNIFAKNKSINYYPCDLFPEIYNYGGKVSVIKADITNIPFEDNYFDAILCNHVLEHIPNDSLAMTELYRVLKKNAWAILQVPIDYSRKSTYEDFSITNPEEREKAFGQKDHVRIYGCDYKDRLKKSGFKVIEDDFVKSFSLEEITRFGLKDSELVYYCQKPTE